MMQSTIAKCITTRVRPGHIFFSGEDQHPVRLFPMILMSISSERSVYIHGLPPHKSFLSKGIRNKCHAYTYSFGINKVLLQQRQILIMTYRQMAELNI